MTGNRIAASALAAGLLLAGCSSTAPPTVDGRPGTAGVGSSTGRAADALSAFAVIAAAVPAAKVGSVITAATDANHLLGRPGQYTSKVTFTDRRVLAADVQSLPPGDVQLGGAIEVFAAHGDAETRAEYIQAVTKSMPVLAEYDYVHGTTVVRVSHFLTPAQAKEYDTAALSLG